MNPPYYRITSRCDNPRCSTDTFVTRRKKVHYVSTCGRLENTTRQVCPQCRTWGHVDRIEEVRQ